VAELRGEMRASLQALNDKIDRLLGQLLCGLLGLLKGIEEHFCLALRPLLPS